MIAALGTAVEFFKGLIGLGIVKTPEQAEREKAAAREAGAQFLTSTSSPLYAIPRLSLFYGSLWDIFFNQGQAWAAAAQRMTEQGLVGFFELAPAAWLLFGPEAWSIVKEIYQAKREQIKLEREKLVVSGPAPYPTDAAGQERWKRINEDMDRLDRGEK